MSEKRYIPALSFHFLTPLYDPILKWVMGEDTFKRKLVSQSRILPSMKVLDLGCGTGTLTVMLKEEYPNAVLTGFDGDSQVLDIARQKSGSLDIQWDQGMAYVLPYPDASFDRVVTSLVIHHLTTEDKRRAFQEVHRTLKPNGELYVLDFGAPHSGVARLITKYMHSLEEAADNFDGLIPQFISEAGFESVSELDHFVSVFGPLSLWRAIRIGE